MRLVEIERKYFNMMEGAAVLIERYANPESELVAEFEARLSDKDTFYYKCNITEKGTGDVVLFLDFFLHLSRACDKLFYCLGNLIYYARLSELAPQND